MLELGCAEGPFAIEIARRGCWAVGLEPEQEATRVGADLAAEEAVGVVFVQGVGEHLPFADATFDIVYANAVLEHVKQLETVIGEAFRVLGPGGAFCFHTSNPLCPVQKEITGYPLFPWYPQGLKRRIMAHCEGSHPDRIGWTSTPAINWLTPWAMKRLLKSVGFAVVCDRWDVAAQAASSPLKSIVSRLMTIIPGAKILADVLRCGASYYAVKSA